MFFCLSRPCPGRRKVRAHWFTAIANKTTDPFVVLWYLGILNCIGPSAGSKWATKAPYLIQDAVIAYAWGDMRMPGRLPTISRRPTRGNGAPLRRRREGCARTRLPEGRIPDRAEALLGQPPDREIGAPEDLFRRR